jgi:CubicO group peptidase (beta-lactamase class C family)
MVARLAAIPLALSVVVSAIQTDLVPSVSRDLDRVLSDSEKDGFTGVFIVRRGDYVVSGKAYGSGSCERSERLTLDSVFDIGSITKVFTAAAVLRAQQDGLLRVDAPLRSFFSDLPPDKEGITVLQLLQHESGFPESAGEDETIVRRDVFLRSVFSQPLAHPPGAHKTYSNIGYSILAAILEKKSGRPFEEYLREAVIAPTHAHVAYSWQGPALPKFACGFREGLAWGSTRDYFSINGPSWYLLGNGGLLTSAGDLDRWFRALIDGTILDPESTRLIVETLTRKGQSGRRVLSVGGSNLIFTSEYLWWPDSNVSAVFLSSTAEWPKEKLLPRLAKALEPLLADHATEPAR